MKKLISMMLMLCAVITFSACSSDDEDQATQFQTQLSLSQLRLVPRLLSRVQVLLQVKLFGSFLSRVRLST